MTTALHPHADDGTQSDSAIPRSPFLDEGLEYDSIPDLSPAVLHAAAGVPACRPDGEAESASPVSDPTADGAPFVTENDTEQSVLFDGVPAKVAIEIITVGPAPNDPEQITASLFHAHQVDELRATKHPATYWRELKPIWNPKEQRRDSTRLEATWILWAPWTVAAVDRRRHFDATGDWDDQYELELAGANGNTTVQLHPDDLNEMRTANAAFQEVGGLARPADPVSNSHGSALMQFRLHVRDLGASGENSTTTNRLGRLDERAGAPSSRYVFPGCTIGSGGPTTDFAYEETRRNRIADHVDVTWKPSCDLPQLLRDWITSACGADASLGFAQTAAVVGWAASATTALRLIDDGVIEGHPYLWAVGTPGSGKTTRVPRLMAPFGQKSGHLLAGMGQGQSQVRDTFTAACDVPVVDEVRLDYMQGASGMRFLELLKVGYNGSTTVTGGAMAGGRYPVRNHRVTPSLAFVSEQGCFNESGVADRIIEVRFERRADLADDVQARTSGACDRLMHATEAGRMSPVAGAWYEFIARTDLAAVRRMVAPHSGAEAVPSSRQRVNLYCILFGLDLFSGFLAEKAPELVGEWLKVVAAFRERGIDHLIKNVDEHTVDSGASGALSALGMLSKSQSGPMNGVHYEVTELGLKLACGQVEMVLRSNARSIPILAPSSKALNAELRQWPGVVDNGRRNSVRWLFIPWTTLTDRTDLERDDFSVSGPSPF